MHINESEHTYKRDRLVTEAAAELRMSAESLMRAIRSGAPHDRLGRRTVRVSIDELRDWLTAREAARAAGKAVTNNSRPKTYATTIEQTYDHHADGTAYVRTVTITTDGNDHTSDWDTMSDAERHEHDKWVEDFHGARVDIAEAKPAVRERVDQMCSRGDEQNGDTLRGYLQAAKEAASKGAA